MLRALFVVGVLLAGCGDDGPAAPTPLPDRPAVTLPTTTSQASDFDDRFWRELVYAEWDRVGNGLSGPMPGGSRVLEHVRHFYILKTGMPPDLVVDLVNAVPDLWRQLTGGAYTGRSGSGHTPPDVPYLTVVRADIDRPFCGGAATHPDDAEAARNEIWLHLETPTCGSARSTFAHEFGHILGFFHVAGREHLMDQSPLVPAFSAKERYHAQLAYRVGPGVEYCGEPFTPGCNP